MLKVWVMDAWDGIDHGHVVIETDVSGVDTLYSYGPSPGSFNIIGTKGQLNVYTGQDVENYKNVQLQKGNNISTYTLNLTPAEQQAVVSYLMDKASMASQGADTSKDFTATYTTFQYPPDDLRSIYSVAGWDNHPNCSTISIDALYNVRPWCIPYHTEPPFLFGANLMSVYQKSSGSGLSYFKN